VAVDLGILAVLLVAFLLLGGRRELRAVLVRCPAWRPIGPRGALAALGGDIHLRLALLAMLLVLTGWGFALALAGPGQMGSVFAGVRL